MRPDRHVAVLARDGWVGGVDWTATARIDVVSPIRPGEDHLGTARTEDVATEQRGSLVEWWPAFFDARRDRCLHPFPLFDRDDGRASRFRQCHRSLFPFAV